MPEISGKKPWSKPTLRTLGLADELRGAIAMGGREDLTPDERQALRKLLSDK